MNPKKITSVAAALILAVVLLLGGCAGSGPASFQPADDGTAAEVSAQAEASGDVAPDAPSEGPSDETPAGLPEPLPVPEGFTALTGEEIAWFNTEFFNGDSPNIHNQFLFSLYNLPQDINLYDTFYIGAGADDMATAEEAAAVVAANGWDVVPDCECQKNSVAVMDAVLMENIGLKLDETLGLGLDMMTYLQAYDAYYHYHGDTNYIGVTVTDGYCDDNGNVWLHYTCVTFYESERIVRLRGNGDGYQFVSNTELSDPPGQVLNADGVPAAVLDQAKEQVLQWFRMGRTQFPAYRYVTWRIESLGEAYTYDDFDGMTLLIYRLNYEFYSETPGKVGLAGGMTVTDDGWVMPSYPDCTYLIFRLDGETLAFLDTIMENDCAPGDETFTSDLRRLLSRAPDSLTADTNAGIEVILDYADDDIVVFHGYFGAFVYDLKESAITSAVDFSKTLGCTNVNGSVVVDVAVSADGKTVQLYLSGVESEMLMTGLDPDEAWYIDTRSGDLTRGAYEKLADRFDNFVGTEPREGMTSFNSIPFPDGDAYLTCDGNTLGSLVYVRGDMLWLLFDRYFD